jgi:hypothetical protein
MMEDALVCSLEDAAIKKGDEMIGAMHGVSLKILVRWDHELSKEMTPLNLKLNTTIEFPLTIEDTLKDTNVRIMRLHDSYAVMSENEDLEMVGLETLPGFRQVKDFSVPRPLTRRVLAIDVWENKQPEQGERERNVETSNKNEA